MKQSHKAVGLLALISIMVLPCGLSEAQADIYDVTLEGFWFQYNGQQNMDIDLTIEPGDTVRWTWIEGFHNVVSGFPGGGNEGELFFSGPPTDAPGTTFQFTFLDPGVFGFHCHPHEEFGMVSFVTVVPAPGAMGLFLVGGLLRRSRRRSST